MCSDLNFSIHFCQSNFNCLKKFEITAPYFYTLFLPAFETDLTFSTFPIIPFHFRIISFFLSHFYLMYNFRQKVESHQHKEKEFAMNTVALTNINITVTCFSLPQSSLFDLCPRGWGGEPRCPRHPCPAHQSHRPGYERGGGGATAIY